MKHIATSSTGCTLLPEIYEISGLSLMLKSLLPDVVKVKFVIDDNRLRSNLTTTKTIKFIKNFFAHKRFTQCI